MLPAAGILIAFLVDLAVPFALALWLAVLNHRAPKPPGRDTIFWSLVGVYLAIVGAGVIGALKSTFEFDGTVVIIAVVLGFPTSLVPAIFNSNVIHFFFNPVEWAELGYLPVLTFFLVGLIAWASLIPLGIRRLAQHKPRMRGSA